MKLLTKQELLYSPVVANNAMNRQRKSTGVNSYEKELKFDIHEFLAGRIYGSSIVRWADLCCGEGRALTETYHYFQQKAFQSIELEGWDLIDGFCEDNLRTLNWYPGSLEDWQPAHEYDLITCIHGLHYIGDKLELIRRCAYSLKKDGLFIANIDFDNVRLEEGKSLKSGLIQLFEQYGFTYSKRRRILSCQGNRKIDFNLNYIGADDQAGPNYTKQPVVNSYYRLRK